VARANDDVAQFLPTLQKVLTLRRDRDHQLVGPISLYLLAVADSGERKTTCDAIFSPELRDWETRQRLEMSPEIAKLDTATAVFEAKKAGILEAIKHKRRRAQDTASEDCEFEALVEDGRRRVIAINPALLDKRT